MVKITGNKETHSVLEAENSKRKTDVSKEIEGKITSKWPLLKRVDNRKSVIKIKRK